jgi:glycosyltransferase involved in cell wall biosynthesis
MNDKRLKIAYITTTDARSRHAWSGTQYSIWNALQKHLGDIELIGSVKPFFPLWFGKIATGLSQKILHKRYDYRHSRMLSMGYARIVNNRLKNKTFDLIVVPATSAFIPYLETSAPIAYISDSTVIRSLNYHKSLSNLYSFSVKETTEIERMALERADFLFYPSQWAASSAINDFHKDPEKVFVAPFGPNMEDLPARELVLFRKKNATCNLLFVGVNWKDKGGPVAFQTMLELNKMGLDTSLTVCGCIPPENFHHPNFKVIPFIDKNNKEGREQLNSLFLHSDFLVFPTRVDCFGIVLCEAYAFGLPVLASDTGGVNAAVENGYTGYLMPYNADGKAYADKIYSLFNNETAYRQLMVNCRNSYETKYNWDNWALAFKQAYQITMLGNQTKNDGLS